MEVLPRDCFPNTLVIWGAPCCQKSRKLRTWLHSKERTWQSQSTETLFSLWTGENVGWATGNEKERDPAGLREDGREAAHLTHSTWASLPFSGHPDNLLLQEEGEALTASFASWVQSCFCCLLNQGRDDLVVQGTLHTLCAHVRSPGQHSTHHTSTRQAQTRPPLAGNFRERLCLAHGRRGPAQCAPCTVSVPSRQLVLFIAGLWQALHSLFPPHALCVVSGLRMPPLVIQTVCSTAQSWAGWKRRGTGADILNLQNFFHKEGI